MLNMVTTSAVANSRRMSPGKKVRKFDLFVYSIVDAKRVILADPKAKRLIPRAGSLREFFSTQFGHAPGRGPPLLAGRKLTLLYLIT